MKKLLFHICVLATLYCLPANAQSGKMQGGDASLLPSYEAQGTIYKDFDGNEVSFLPFVKQQ